ncbi:9133_t:CDS:2, partial [Cetraspora pellucida]
YGINNSITDNVADGFQVVGEAAQPFLQFFQSVTIIVDSITRAYKNGKCNQKICLALIDRVEIAQQAVKSLERQQMENEELFKKQDYYNAWVRFIVVLENTNKFVKEVTQLSSLQKFLTANAVKDAFDKNIKEFEEVCKDLDFTLAIYDRNKKELENKRIMEDINVLTKNMNDSFSEQMKELTQLSEKFDQLMKRTTNIDSTLIEAYREPEINPRELVPDSLENDSGKTILKRSYRGIKVACKKITESYEPKISNFWLSRDEKEISVRIENILNIIRWLAPEKISNSQYSSAVPYDHQCEMYSFGMLLWELCHQRIPYENINSVPEIEQLVRNNKREKMLLDPNPIAQELFKIIKQAWHNAPAERPKVMNILTTLQEAYEKYVPKGVSPMILPKNINNNNIPPYNLEDINKGDTGKFPEDCRRFSLDNIP